MVRRGLAEGSAYLGVAMLLGTAAWHQTGYISVTTMAGEGSPALKPLMAALWLYFALALVLTAALVLVVARVGAPNRAIILTIAALSPIGGASVQVVHLGFILPTALLLADGLVILMAALLGRLRYADPAPRA